MNEAQELACRCLHEVHQGIHYSFDTPAPVRWALSRLVGSGQRIRLFLGEPKTGKNWLEENDLTGTIGRSMGPCKVPLLIHNQRSLGGGSVLVDCIMAIQANPYHFYYRHPEFKIPEIDIRESECEGYNASAWINGENHANFKTFRQAERWAAFMRGERMAK